MKTFGLCVCLLPFLVGCGVTSHSKKTDFYRLGGPPLETRSVSGEADALVVHPVRLPESLTRASIVQVNSPHHLGIQSRMQWGGSLSEELQASLIRYLGQQQERRHVTSDHDAFLFDKPYGLYINVLALDFGAGDGEQVAMDALWSVGDSCGELVRAGQFSESRKAASTDMESQLKALDGLVEHLAVEITRHINDSNPGCQ